MGTLGFSEPVQRSGPRGVLLRRSSSHLQSLGGILPPGQPGTSQRGSPLAETSAFQCEARATALQDGKCFSSHGGAVLAWASCCWVLKALWGAGGILVAADGSSVLGPQRLVLNGHPPVPEGVLPPTGVLLVSSEKFSRVLVEQQQDRARREQERIRLFSADPFDLEAQAKIEEDIR